MVLAPDGDGRSGLVQCLEPVVVKALVPELAIEAFDVAVLHGPAKLNQDMLDAVLLRPCHRCPARELWPVVSPDRLGVTPKCGCSVQQAGDVVATNTIVGRDVHAFMAEVVSHRQALDPPAVGQAVAHKIHAPHLVD